MSPKDILQVNPENYQRLSDAFAKFNETSARLEEKYQLLLEETQVLKQTLKEKDREIKRQEKLALLGETAAAIAHEVRNPLGAMKLFLSLLRKDVEDKPDSIRIVDQIDTSINTINNVVNNILQFSRDKELHVGPVNIHSILKELVHAFPRSETNQTSFDISLKATAFIVGSDTGLRQVFHNIILNAMQAMGYKGWIHINTTDCEGGVTVEIIDSGPGVPAELQETIFDPFVTSKNEGTGLGLAIVKQIIEFHGGSVKARNCPGACISIFLPRNFKEKQV